MLVEILTYKGKPATGCLTTSAGRLWADDTYYRGYIKNGALELEVPDWEAEIMIAKELVREVRKPVTEAPKSRRKTPEVPTVVTGAAEVKRVDPLE